MCRRVWDYPGGEGGPGRRPTRTVASYSSEVATRGSRPASVYAVTRGADLRRTDLDQQVPAGGQPGRGGRGDAAQQRQPVGPAVESGPGLVLAGLGRHHRDRLGRDVRRVRDEQVDPPAQRRRQRVEQVADVGHPGVRRQVLPRARHRRRVHVHPVQGRHPGRGRRDRRADRPVAAAQVDHHRRPRAHGERLLDQEAGPGPRHEHPRRDHQPQPAELRPAEDVLQWLPRHPSLPSARRAPRP